MTDDLVKRLRELAGRYDEAAERIEKLERENNDMVVHFDGLVARIEKLEAALREIADSANWDNAGCWNADSYPDEIARKALEGKDE